MTRKNKLLRKGATVVTINGFRGKVIDVSVIGTNEWFDVTPESGGFAQAFLASELSVLR